MFPIQIGKRIDEVFKKTQHGKNQRSDAWRLLQTGDAGATTRAQNQMSQDQQIGSSGNQVIVQTNIRRRKRRNGMQALSTGLPNGVQARAKAPRAISTIAG
ncbi:MAG: hypothetical protein KA972_03005 [Brachymonas sp.]|nr:hypothetical protein [Brachymonas sp.]